MIKLFGGKDLYESYTRAKNDAQKTSVRVKSPLKIIDVGEIESFENFIQELEGVGMFAEESVFFIKRISSNKKVETYFTDNYSSLKNLEIIIWEDNNPDGRSNFIKTLKKDGVLFLYEEVKEKDLKVWILDEAKKQKINIKNTEVDYLIQNLELDKFVIQNELKKIRLFLENKGKKEVTTEEINDILGFNIKGNIWKFLDYFGERNKSKCLKEYLKLTAFEDNTQYLIAMIERELSIISQIKYSEKNNLDLRDLKLHPFVLQKSQAKARNYKWEELKFFFTKLLNLDFAIKNGDIDEKLGLTLYLLSI